MRIHQFLLVLLLFTPVNMASAATITTCPNQCGGYSNVQAAIKEASPGDTVALEPGVYRESIVLNKSITLVGSGDDTILLGSGPNPVLAVTADDIEIRNLRVSYCLFGVQAAEVSGLTVSGCSFVNCSVGILIDSCTEVEVERCNIADSMYAAVTVIESANVTVAKCVFKGGEEGVSITRSGSNDVLDSSFEDCGQGVILDDSNQNLLKGNAFHGCVDAVVLSVSGGNTVEGSEAEGVDRFMGAYMSVRNLVVDNLVGECVYTYDYASSGNLYRLGPVNVTGSDYVLGLTEAAAPPGYEAVSETLNVSLIHGTLVDGYAMVSVKVSENQYMGREPGDMGLYRVSDGGVHPVAQGYFLNATVQLNATIRDDGLYTVLLWRDSSPPTAAIKANASAVVGEPVLFDASGSSDDVGVVAYAWSFGDGEEGEGEAVTHSFPEPGVYEVTLTVSDAYGNVGKESYEVAVEEPERQASGNTIVYVLVGVVLVGAVAALYIREKRYLEREAAHAGDNPDHSLHRRSRG
jgi:parallel beta-helix repeat protein